MAALTDPAPELQEHARPERLLTTKWLAEHLDDEGLVIIDSDEDAPPYDTGHICGAVNVDWRLGLNNQVIRNYIGVDESAPLYAAEGIRRDARASIPRPGHETHPDRACSSTCASPRSIPANCCPCLGIRRRARSAVVTSPAWNVPWREATNDDGTFKRADQLKVIHGASWGWLRRTASSPTAG